MTGIELLVAAAAFITTGWILGRATANSKERQT